MSIYQENKIFINKFKSILMREARDNSVDHSLQIFFSKPYINPNTKVSARLVLKYTDIVTEEVGKKIYFGVIPKASEFYFMSKSQPQNDLHKIAQIAYSNSISYYSTPESVATSIRNYLKKANITDNGRGMSIDRLDNRSLFSFVKEDDGKALSGYEDVINLEKDIKAIKDSQLEIYLNPEIYRSVKDRSMIPVAYIDTEKNALYYPTKLASSKKTNIFDWVPLTGETLTGRGLDRIARQSFNYLPTGFWIVCEIKSDVVDRKKYMGYNYDI